MKLWENPFKNGFRSMRLIASFLAFALLLFLGFIPWILSMGGFRYLEILDALTTCADRGRWPWEIFYD